MSDRDDDGSRSILSSSAVMATGTVVSRASGFVRNALLAALEELRAYFQSIDIEGLVGGGLTEENLVRALHEGGSSLDEFLASSTRAASSSGGGRIVP